MAIGMGLGASIALAAPAEAGVEKVHVGVLAHNICIQNCDSADKEEGQNIELQLDFNSPGFLDFAFSPAPYLIVSGNTAGDTSYYGAGLEWSFGFAEHWSVEPSLGYIIHDGATELPYASGTPEAAEFSANNVLLGSKDLFRLSLGVTHDLPGPWAAQFMVLHLSHGQMLGSGRNQGLDQAGLRLSYAFGG
jgi:lipid A 3-O-deacylase